MSKGNKIYQLAPLKLSNDHVTSHLLNLCKNLSVKIVFERLCVYIFGHTL